MSLPNDIISFLRDEAYLTLSREALSEALHGVAVHKEEVASTRPPFGVLAAPSTVKTFEHSMRTVLDNESSLETRLARIDTLDHWLKATLHTKLHYYLWDASQDYRYSAEVLSAIDTWERFVDPYGDRLQAFARELKNTARAVERKKEGTHAVFDLRAGAMAELRISALSLDSAAGQLIDAERKLSQVIAGTIYDKVRILPPSFVDMGQWVDRLTPLSDEELFATTQAMEADVRALLAKKLAPLHARAEAARETVADAGRHYFEQYWDQLRTHALTYYVKDREVDEVLEELTQRYVAATAQRGQQILQGKVNPYQHER